MAMIPQVFTSDKMSTAMLDGLLDCIRSELRERILERIEPDIKAAVDASIETFKINIQQYHELEYGRDMLKLMIERKDKKQL